MAPPPAAVCTGSGFGVPARLPGVEPRELPRLAGVEPRGPFPFLPFFPFFEPPGVFGVFGVLGAFCFFFEAFFDFGRDFVSSFRMSSAALPAAPCPPTWGPVALSLQK
jgi:hypothetical protein